MTITTQGWTLDGLVVVASNFQRAPSLDYRTDDLVAQVNKLLDDGIPVIVTGFNNNSNWDPCMFRQHRKHTSEKTQVTVRNVLDGQTRPLKLGRFFGYCNEVEPFAQPKDRQRLVTTDMEPPPTCIEWLCSGETLPRDFLPLDNNDLLRHLPKKCRPVTLMCNYAMGDAYASWYKDLCALVGQNLMVHAGEDTSAFWFMTGTHDADRVSSYFHSQGQELDQDEGPSFILPERLANAPFTIFVCQQEVGDLVLFPPRSAQQFIAKGGLTGHIAWSRATFSALANGLYHELPIYNRVARPEKYRLKLSVYFAVRHYATLPASQRGIIVLEELLDLLDTILIAEYAHGVLDLAPASPRASYDRAKPEFFTCDSCHADIFISHFHCDPCDQDICSECYVSGRGCSGAHPMNPAVAVRFQEVLDQRNECATALARAKGAAVPQMTEARIQLSAALQTFRAACVLRNSRLCPNGTSTCAHNDHNVPSASTLECKICDKRICFAHLLEGPTRMHAARAIVEHDRLSPEDWHKLHSDPGPVSTDYDDCDVAGLYLAAVTCKYPDQPDSDIKTRSWYSSRLPEDRENYYRVQEELANVLQRQINEVLASIHDASTAEPDSLHASQDTSEPSKSSNRSTTVAPSETPLTSCNAIENMDVDLPVKNEILRPRKRKTVVVSSDDDSEEDKSVPARKPNRDVKPVAKKLKTAMGAGRVPDKAIGIKIKTEPASRTPARLLISTQSDGKRGSSSLSPATSTTTFSPNESKSSSRTTPAASSKGSTRGLNPPSRVDLENYSHAASTLSPPPAYQSPEHHSTSGPPISGQQEHAHDAPLAKFEGGTNFSDTGSAITLHPARPPLPKFKKFTSNPVVQDGSGDMKEERTSLRHSVWLFEALPRMVKIFGPTELPDDSWQDDIVHALSSAGANANNRLRQCIDGLLLHAKEQSAIKVELDTVKKQLAEARIRVTEAQLKLKVKEEVLRQERDKNSQSSVQQSRWDSAPNIIATAPPAGVVQPNHMHVEHPRGWQEGQYMNNFNTGHSRVSHHWRGTNFRANNGFSHRNYLNQRAQPFQNGTPNASSDKQGYNSQFSTSSQYRVHQYSPRKYHADGKEAPYHQGRPYTHRNGDSNSSRPASGLDIGDKSHPPSRGRSLTRSPVNRERSISLGEASETSFRRPRMHTHSLSRSPSRSRSRSRSRRPSLRRSYSRSPSRAYSRSRSRSSRSTYSRTSSRSPRGLRQSRSHSRRGSPRRSTSPTMESSHLQPEPNDGIVI